MSGSVNDMVGIQEMYLGKKKSTSEIAKAIGIPISRVRKTLLDSGVQLRSKSESISLRSEHLSQVRRGKKRPPISEETRGKMSESRKNYWDGKAKGVSLKPSGYVEITTGKHKGRSVHVVMMEQRLGRRLLPDECVHHIDENRSNNKYDNLALVTKSGHTRLHRYQDKIAGTQIERESNGRFC